MRKRASFAMAAVGAAFATTLTFGSAPASAAVDEKISGTVYDNGWSHYKLKRCARIKVYLDVTTSPDDDHMYHYASKNQGGGSSYGTVRADEFTGAKYLNLNTGCFYMNSRQQEGTFESDWEDVWYGEIDY
jgi:hypothetical protein